MSISRDGGAVMSAADEDRNMPCGRCDMGVYSEEAALNRVAREFSVLSDAQRLKQMPRCKTKNRRCVGAIHYSQMISEIDAAHDKRANP